MTSDDVIHAIRDLGADGTTVASNHVAKKLGASATAVVAVIEDLINEGRVAGKPISSMGQGGPTVYADLRVT